MSVPGVVSYEAPHVPAAFINHIHEDGTKAEAVQWLQRTWNEYQAALEQMAALKAERSFVVASLAKVCVELEHERTALREMLNRYMAAYPAFRIKPVGSPGSQARDEQERLMALEEAARELVKS